MDNSNSCHDRQRPIAPVEGNRDAKDIKTNEK
jgi:hypothetical protein